MSNNSNIFDLAHNIGFATLRVARLVQHSKLRAELEGSAIDLVRRLDSECIDSLSRMIRLTETVGQMSNINAITLERELVALKEKLHSAITTFPLPDEAEIMSIFGKVPEIKKTLPEAKEMAPDIEEDPDPETRRSAILGFIRQLPDGCRMKDIQTRFSIVGERTLRTDIGKLIEDGFIIREGKSGPHSFLTAVGGDTFLIKADARI